jgi:hypothetical protein
VRLQSGARFGVARSDVEAEIVDRHMDAETDLLPPTAEDRAASNARARSDSQSKSQSGSQSGSQPDRLAHDPGKEQVARSQGGGGE